MTSLDNKHVLVLGLGGRGRAACGLLRRAGARVSGVDSGDTAELREETDGLRALGVAVTLGAKALPPGEYDFAVISPAVPPGSQLAAAATGKGLRLFSELELGLQQAKCLSIAISGTNGKGTVAALVERVLANNHRKTIVAGHRARPIGAVADQTNDLDFLILQVNALQLESTRSFHPSVAVLMNLAPDHAERFPSPGDYARAYAVLFREQEAFDWAVVQAEALSRLREWNVPVPAKAITFSASDSSADLHLDRGLLISRLENWPGPLLDMDHCRLRGPHNAENFMAALAVGHALRLPLETMVDPLKSFASPPHCCEPIAAFHGVEFVNDAKATNCDALAKALLAMPSGTPAQPNIWLIAGGRDPGADFHDVVPLLAKRVKGAFLIGEASERLRAAWSLFIPCILSPSLLEAVSEAAKNASTGDVVLFSPACSSFDQFRDYQHRGEVFCQAVKSIGRGAFAGNPNMDGNEARSAGPGNSVT